jgi:hypothetical protein
MVAAIIIMITVLFVSLKTIVQHSVVMTVMTIVMSILNDATMKLIVVIASNMM